MVQYLVRRRYAFGEYSGESWGPNWWAPLVHRTLIQVHFLAAVAFLLVVPFQVSKYVRDRHRAAHRWAGRVFVALVIRRPHAAAVSPGATHTYSHWKYSRLNSCASDPVPLPI